MKYNVTIIMSNKQGRSFKNISEELKDWIKDRIGLKGSFYLNTECGEVCINPAHVSIIDIERV